MTISWRTLVIFLALPLTANAAEHAINHKTVSDVVIKKQREALNKNTEGKWFGPQSPRDIDTLDGNDEIIFSTAPPYSKMNLCNIHFHKNAEHKGGEFTVYAGNGDGHGFETGYKYSGKLTKAEVKPFKGKVCPSEHGALQPGDTIEVHYVYSTAHVKPGATLGACMNESINNPQLRVESQVFVLVNDKHALDFNKLTAVAQQSNLYQAVNLPTNTGKPVEYAGSTTGPSYDEQGSPFEVTWGVRPKVAKVNIATVGQWCEGNEFSEDHAHGVRNLVVNKHLLSTMAP